MPRGFNGWWIVADCFGKVCSRRCEEYSFTGYCLVFVVNKSWKINSNSRKFGETVVVLRCIWKRRPTKYIIDGLMSKLSIFLQSSMVRRHQRNINAPIVVLIPLQQCQCMHTAAHHHMISPRTRRVYNKFSIMVLIMN